MIGGMNNSEYANLAYTIINVTSDFLGRAIQAVGLVRVADNGAYQPVVYR